MAPISEKALFQFVAQFLSTIRADEDDPNRCKCVGSCIRNWKIIFAVILFVEALFFGFLVFFIRNRLKSKNALKTLTIFGEALSAGLFLSTGFLHILPEAIALMSGDDHHDDEACGSHDDAGEHDEKGRQLLFSAVRQNDTHNHDEDEHNHDEDEHNHDEDEHNHEGDEHNHDNHEGHDEHGHGSHEISYPWAYFVVICGFYAFFFIEKILVPKIFGTSTHDHDHDATEEKTIAVDEDTGDVEASGVTKAEPSAPIGEGFKSRAFAIAVIQILGISAHSLFESMALGLSQGFSGVLNIFIATVSHRWATAIAIAFTRGAALSFWPFLTIFLLFSAMVPLGIGIGAGINETGTTTRGVLFALSAATFVYIGAYEAMADTFSSPKWLGRKFLTVLLGAAIISGITGILVGLKIHG